MIYPHRVEKSNINSFYVMFVWNEILFIIISSKKNLMMNIMFIFMYLKAGEDEILRNRVIFESLNFVNLRLLTMKILFYLQVCSRAWLVVVLYL